MIRIAYQQGDHCLIYDTDDVERADLSAAVEPVEVPSSGFYREYVAGQASMTVHLTFKPGKRARWIKVTEDDAPTPRERELTAEDDARREFEGRS